MREYFASLGDSAHPNSSDPRARAITRFQELLLVSFREFAVITDDTIYKGSGYVEEHAASAMGAENVMEDAEQGKEVH